jgi:hypothetical protein
MTWKEITTSDDFKSLPQNLRSEIKQTYFQSSIAPELKGASEQDFQLAYEDWMSTPDDTGEGYVTSLASSAARGLLRPLSDIPIAVGALTGSEGIESFGEDIQAGVESTFPVNPAQAGIGTDVAGVAGQVGSMLLGGGAGALTGRAISSAATAAKLGAKAAVGTQAFTGGAAGGAQRADELGLEGGQKQLRALLGGATELAVEALPFGMLTETSAARKLLGETGEKAAKESIESGWMSFVPRPVKEGIKTESIEEGFTEGIGQATDIAFAPEQANMDLQQVGKAMLLGGVGGAMFGGVNAAIAPKTAEAFKYEGEFVRVRDFDELPADVKEEYQRGDTRRLVPDKNGKLIGYKPAAETIEADMPTEIIVPDDIAPEIVPEVTQMVEGLTQNPTVPQVSKALAEDFQSGLTELPQPDMQANLLAGMPMLATPTQTITLDFLPQQPLMRAVPMQPTPPQTITGSNVQTGTEMPVLDESPVTSPGVAPQAAKALAEDFGEIVVDEPEVLPKERETGSATAERKLNYQGKELPYTVNIAQASDGGYKVKGIKVQFGGGLYERIPFPQDGQTSFDSVDEARAAADQFIQAYSGDALPQPDMQANLLTGVPMLAPLGGEIGTETATLEGRPIEETLTDETTATTDDMAAVAEAAEEAPALAGGETEVSGVSEEAAGVADDIVENVVADEAAAGMVEPMREETKQQANQRLFDAIVSHLDGGGEIQIPGNPPARLTQKNAKQLRIGRDGSVSFGSGKRSGVIPDASLMGMAAQIGERYNPLDFAVKEEERVSDFELLKEVGYDGGSAFDEMAEILGGSQQAIQEVELMTGNDFFDSWPIVRKSVANGVLIRAGKEVDVDAFADAMRSLVSRAQSLEGRERADAMEQILLAANINQANADTLKRRKKTQQVSATADVPTESLESQLAQESPEISGTSPTPESLPAKGQLTSRDVGAGVAVQRDATKPEQMTPEERGLIGHQEVIELAKQDYELAKTGQTWGYSGGQNYKSKAAAVKDTKDRLAKVSNPTESDIKRGASDHYGEVNKALEAQNPVSSAAVEAYSITLPAGYTLNETGDLYIFNATPAPQAQPPAATTATQEAESKAAALATVTATEESTAAEPAAVETDVAGPSQRLRDYITTLPAKAQAAWTPERLAAADSYYATGDTAALEPLTKVQQKVVKERATDDTEKLKFEAAQKRAFELRNPPPVTESEFLADPNALLDSQTDEQLQQERARRIEYGRESKNTGDTGSDAEASGEDQVGGIDSERNLDRGDVGRQSRGGVGGGRPSLLRAQDGTVLRTGVESIDAEAARNSYDGVIPGVEQTWVGTTADFAEQFPDGYPLGDNKTFPESYHEALVAPDGRAFIFTDQVEILEGDVARAREYGTTPGVEAVKRTLRHESFAHRGFMALPHPLKRRFMDLIESGVIPQAELDYLVTERKYSNLADWRDNISTRQMAAEEWLAHKLERMTELPKSGPVAEFLDWLRDVWDYLTGGAKPNDAVLRDTLRQMHKALGALEPGQRIIDEQVRASQRSSETPRFKELTRDLPAKPTAADIAKFQETHPDEYQELVKMRADVLRRGGWDVKAYHGTPTGGFTEFSPEYQGRTGGRARGGFSFTTNLKAAESYAKSFSDESVALDEAIRVANASLIPHRKNNALVEYFSEIGYDGLPEFYWGAIDSNSEFADSLRYFADGIESIQPDVASAFRQSATILESGDTVKPEIKSVLLRLGEVPLTFDATPSTLGEVVAGLDVRGTLSKSAVVSMPDGEKVFYVADPNQIKSADPLATDNAGNLITPDQWADETSPDIRASRQSDPINNNPSFSSASVPKTTAPRNPNRMLNEIQIGADGIRRVIPKKYLPFAEKFGFQKALKEWAKDLMQPYVGSIQDLRRLLMVMRDPARTQAVLGITPQDGSSIIPSILELAALKADKLGNTTLGDVFRSERQKVGSQAGQNLAAIKAANLDEEFSPNRIGNMIQGIEQDDQKARVDKDINPKNVIPEVEATLEAANDGASSNVEDGVNDETMISMRILELGVAAEDDPWLRGKLEELVAAIIDYGEAAAETDVRASIADKRVASKAAPADRMAVAAETIKRINREINEHLKKKTKKATPVDGEKTKATKEPKEKLPKPIQTAKEIIDSIAKKVTGQQKAKPEPNKVRQLYKQQLKQPKVEAEFLKEALALGVDAVTAKKLHDSINLEIIAISVQAQRAADIKQRNKELSEAEDASQEAQKKAEAKIKEVSERLSDPSLTQDAKKAQEDEFRRIYNDQVKRGGQEDVFVQAMQDLGVDFETARSLYDIANLDSQSRREIRQAQDDIRRAELSEAAASRLIYAQEEELRQGSKDRETNSKGDSINKAFREQLTKPLELDAFISRLAALKVSAKTAERLYKTAERVAFDNAMGEAFAKRIKFLDVDSSALANFVNDLRRRGKLTGEAIDWRNLLSMPVTDQFTIKETLLERIKMHSAMRDLTASEQQALADALETVWQKERRKLFQQMIKRAERKGMTKDAKQRIEDATPKLLEYINQGMLASDAFYKAVGEQYGWQPVSKEDRAKLEKLAAEMQEPGISSMERNMKQEEIVRVLQRNTRLSRAEVLSSFWVLSVLMGGRTQFDMAGGILSGALSILKKAVAVATTGKDPKLALKGLSDFGKFMVIAGEQSYNYVMKGESGIILNRRSALNDSFTKDKLSNVLPTGDKLMLLQDKPGDSEWQLTKNKLARGLGKFMGFWERLMAGWDHITASATYHGTMRLASGLNPKMFDAALIPNDADWENAMAMAKLRRPEASRAQTTALAQSLLIDGIRSLGREIEESRMDQWRNMVAQAMAEGSTASYQETPTGFGGVVYDSIRRITEGTEKGAKEWSEKQKATYLENMGPINAIFKHLGELGYIIATQAQNILGVRFMRFTGNKLNELISYVPVLGLGRLREEGMMDNGEYTLRGRNVYHNQALGWASLTLYIYMMTRLDEPDEEKNVIVEGSWENLTPARKSQLMAAGRKPNTVRIKTSDGKELSFNYVSWPFAGWLAGFGSLSDVKRYTPDKWTEKAVIDKTMSAAYAGAFAISDISSLSSLSELFGRSTYSTDPTEAFVKRISKAGSNYVGGFVPKFIKDIDSWFDDSAYRPENTWQHLAAQMPLLRRSAGAPVRDIFYEPVNVSRAPWSRAIQMSPDEQEYMLLGRLNSRGIWLTPPNADNRKVKSRTGKARDMTEEEAVKYMQLTGEGYKQMLKQHGERLLSMDRDDAARLVEKYAARVRERALKKAVARGAATVTVEAL